MELTLKTDLRVGQMLYYLESKEKNIYKPCPACDNQRKVEFQHNGFTFTADCPECTGKQVKGDKNNSITIKEYSVSDTKINSFKCEDNETFTINGEINIISLTQGKTYWNDPRQYYVDKEKAKEAAKKLNKEEKQKASEFLKENSNA